MTTLTHLNLPDRQESELAQRGQRELAAYLSTRLETQRIAIVGEDDKAHTIELPTSALTLLMEILGELASGNILNVSRPHMVKLLEARKLPFHKTGRHRRVLFADLMEYKKRREQESLDAMQSLADQAQDLGMY